MLQQKIISDFKESRGEERDALKVIVGEFQRQPKKVLSDDETEKILRKLSHGEKELLEAKKQESSTYLEVIKAYLPPEVSENTIRAWLEKNVDWSSLKNKMEAIKLVKAHFGPTTDGNVVKKLIMKR